MTKKEFTPVDTNFMRMLIRQGKEKFDSPSAAIKLSLDHDTIPYYRAGHEVGYKQAFDLIDNLFESCCRTLRKE